MRPTAFWLLASLLANGVLAGLHLLQDRAPERGNAFKRRSATKLPMLI